MPVMKIIISNDGMSHTNVSECLIWKLQLETFIIISSINEI